MTGFLCTAAFMALVIVGAGLPTGLFAPTRRATTDTNTTPKGGTR